jgi:hypothetical protein
LVENETPLTFRIPFLRPWLLAVALLAVPILVVAGCSTLAGQPGAGAAALVGLACAGGVLALPIGLAVGIGRWQVDASGIRGPDSWMIRRHVRWEEIDSVSAWPIPGYRFVWLNTAQRRWLVWVPLFLKDMTAFRAAVRKFAALDNPLRRYLKHHPT